jgi:hypothetical protein
MSQFNWKRPSNIPGGLWDGDQFLAAVKVCSSDKSKEWWEYSVITIHCDEHYFNITEGGECWGWDFSDIEWLIPIKEIAVPDENR